MEEEPSEDLPGEVEEEVEDPPRSSSAALEVEEEILMPTSSSMELGKDATGPSSSPLEGEEDLKETSLPCSERGETSELAVPQAQSPLEDSEGFWSPTSSSRPMSPLPLKGHQGVLQPAEHEEGSEDTESATANLTKKQMKKAVVKKGSSNYTVRPVVPAEKAELLSVAKAMHRDSFGKNVRELFHLEKEAALRSIETGLYIGWRCPEYLWDCFRVGDESKCFCGHLLKQHQIYVERRATVPCTLPKCPCQSFEFIPSRPEEVGEFWLQRRTGFDPTAWRAMCRCKHSHEQHTPASSRSCTAPGCSCMVFASSFLCAACDRCWEEHETFFELEETRRKGGRPYGEAYLPFAEMPDLRNAVLTGRPEDRSSPGLAMPSSGSRALPLPPSGPCRIVDKDDKKA